MTTRIMAAAFVIVPLLLGASSSTAQPTEFFGEDLNPGLTVPPGGNAEMARDDFLAELSSGVGNEDFESFGLGTTAPLPISFPGSTGSITATLSGNGCVEASTGGGCTGANFVGRFNTSPGGDQWWEATNQFSIAFSSPVAAFGFYATDIGDFNGQVTLTATNGTVTNLVIPNTVNGPNGSLLFYGFIDRDNSYTSITFGNTAAGTDFFGFDDMVIGDPGQIGPDIDIKPGSDPNAINVTGLGVIPVAILGSDTFDVADVDVTTLAFGPDEAAPIHDPAGHFDDVNLDGFTDLVTHYATQETGILFGDIEACLTGELLDATPIDACDDIKTVIRRCGLGFEVALVLVPWMLLRRRRA